MTMLRVLAVGLTLVALSTAARSEPQHEGRPHPGPRGYHAMCARSPALCMHDRLAARQAGVSAPARLDARRAAELEDVNRRINRRLAPADDMALHGRSDFWTEGRAAGDCEDYMIAKKQALIAAGWAADQLLYAVVEGRRTRYHAVLVARTDRGDLVLDNRTHRILPWERSGYRFVVRQSAANPYAWVRIVATDAFRADAGAALATR